MRILFNLTATQPIGKNKYHGGGQYGVVVFKYFYAHYPDLTAIFYDDNNYIDEGIKTIINSCSVPIYKKSEISLFDAARMESKVIYTSLYNLSVLPTPPNDITIIKTLHGLRKLEMPGDAIESAYKNSSKSIIQQIINLASCKIKHTLFKNKSERINDFQFQNIKVITVSNHSLGSIMTFYPNANIKEIKVYYSPSTIDDTIDITSLPNQYGKYWLMVSGNRWLKNSARAIIAFDQLFTEHPQLIGKVVITGLKSWEELKIEIRHKERFILLGYVNNVELKTLYHNAYAFVYPSLNEGFGYPPLEAMNEGCPVITSSIASIPEICGDAVIYFNPFLISEIKMRILQMEMHTVRDEYIAKGREREKIIHQRQDEDLVKMCEYMISFLQQ